MTDITDFIFDEESENSPEKPIIPPRKKMKKQSKKLPIDLCDSSPDKNDVLNQPTQPLIIPGKKSENVKRRVSERILNSPANKLKKDPTLLAENLESTESRDFFNSVDFTAI